ncbi:MAG: hypothetical protein BZY88_01545 [SAR202 cluster bacterium Io17-Chloro-G9]|nr:MAG: hypothetical protein BZY88_01545 [SAR202 cluster bacterium Io17-Chloro-G9]
MRLGDFEITEPLPQLKNPHVLAVLKPWIDVGNVGSLGLARMERHLRATELGRLVRPGRFYDFTRYRPRTRTNKGVRELSIPNTILRYAVREEGPDLVFMHLREPHLYAEDYTESVVKILKILEIERFSLVGGMYDMVPHTRPLLVTGGAQKPENEEEYRMVRARPSNYEGPTSITFLISQEAEKLGIDTRTYVVHLPQYFQVDEDFTGTARLMEILCQLYQLPNRLMDRQRGSQQYQALENIVSDTSEVSSLLNRLEERYDREQREESGEQTEPSPLSPDVENFLRELNEGFDSTEEN